MIRQRQAPARLQDIIILPSSEAYADQMEALTGIVYGVDPRQDDYTFNADHYRQHVRVFPEAQFIALDTRNNQVVGLTSGMRTQHDPAHRHTESWWDAVGRGTLSTHVPDGDWMYGVESCVHPEYRGCGVGSQLMDARFNVLKRLTLRGMIAGSAIIDYHKVADTVPVEQYVADVVAGRRFDTNLSKQLHKGFTAQYIIPGYLFHDWNCAGYGVLIQWDNPDYRPLDTSQRLPLLYPALKPVVPVFS
jgi:GNAT superfamily N-acetyltransferase